jgi:FkbM family methyltransferase
MILARTDAQPVRGIDAHGKLVTSLVGVGSSLLETGSHTQDQVDLLLQMIGGRKQAHPDNKMTVVDCGAHIGCVTLPIAKYMTGWGNVVAIEAQEWMYYALCGNIALNNCFNVRAVQAAASDQEGFMHAPVVDYAQPANFGGVSMLPEHNGLQPVQSYDATVRTVTIDGLRLPRLDLLKVDVEGMEPLVLRGAQAMIERHRPIVHVEHFICGSDKILAQLPSCYRHQEIGPNMLCMDASDPLWARLRMRPAA